MSKFRALCFSGPPAIEKIKMGTFLWTCKPDLFYQAFCRYYHSRKEHYFTSIQKHFSCISLNKWQALGVKTKDHLNKKYISQPHLMLSFSTIQNNDITKSTVVKEAAHLTSNRSNPTHKNKHNWEEVKSTAWTKNSQCNTVDKSIIITKKKEKPV